MHLIQVGGIVLCQVQVDGKNREAISEHAFYIGPLLRFVCKAPDWPVLSRHALARSSFLKVRQTTDLSAKGLTVCGHINNIFMITLLRDRNKHKCTKKFFSGTLYLERNVSQFFVTPRENKRLVFLYHSKCR